MFKCLNALDVSKQIQSHLIIFQKLDGDEIDDVLKNSYFNILMFARQARQWSLLSEKDFADGLLTVWQPLVKIFANGYRLLQRGFGGPENFYFFFDNKGGRWSTLMFYWWNKERYVHDWPRAQPLWRWKLLFLVVPLLHNYLGWIDWNKYKHDGISSSMMDSPLLYVDQGRGRKTTRWGSHLPIGS